MEMTDMMENIETENMHAVTEEISDNAENITGAASGGDETAIVYTPLTALQKKNINKTCQKVLKLPGNNMKGDVLEMTLVVDCALDRNFICERAKEVLTSLRSEGKSFLNLRLNLVKWKGSDDFVKYVSSYPDVLMNRTVDPKDLVQNEDKTLDSLTAQLKKYYARSRIHLLILKKEYDCENFAAVSENLNPFTGRKMVVLYPDGTIRCPFTVKAPETDNTDKADSTEVTGEGL